HVQRKARRFHLLHERENVRRHLDPLGKDNCLFGHGVCPLSVRSLGPASPLSRRGLSFATARSIVKFSQLYGVHSNFLVLLPFPPSASSGQASTRPGRTGLEGGSVKTRPFVLSPSTGSGQALPTHADGASPAKPEFCYASAATARCDKTVIIGYGCGLSPSGTRSAAVGRCAGGRGP